MWRLFAIIFLGAAAVIALSTATEQPTRWATIIILSLLIGILFTDVLRLIARTNAEIARLVTTLQYGDFSQSFHAGARDINFPALGEALEELVSGLRKEMTTIQSESSHLASLIDHVPIPLLCIDSNDGVTLLNNAARRLFNRPHGRRLGEFAIYGQGFVAELRSNDATRVVCITPHDDAAQQMRMTQTRVTMLNQPQRLIALQPIQSDIDAAELALSNDLVRVLTHEIMNSLTPVTSLAKSAATLSKQLPASAENDTLHSAIDTVARRSDGLMQFVSRYREVTGIPVLHLELLPLKSLIEEMETLFRAEFTHDMVTLKLDLLLNETTITADKDLLTHVLINLLRNAAQASIGHTETPIACVRVRSTHSGRVLIDVDDNGTGIPDTLRTDIFLPFLPLNLQVAALA